MGSISRKKIFILIIITLILFIIIGISSTNQGSFKSISNIVSIPFQPIIKTFNNLGAGVAGFFNNFGDIRALKEENQALKNELQKLSNENEHIVFFRKENIELKEALNLIDFFTKSDIIGANVIAKNTDNWFDIFTVDIGTSKDVKLNIPVVNSANALVGRVIEADLFSSKVLPITDPESKISGMLIKKGAGLVRITGDYNLSSEGYCKIIGITEDIDITVGDIVQTSGMGGIYPKGIAIGRVENVYKKNGEIHREALLKIFADYKEMDKVFLIIERSNEN